MDSTFSIPNHLLDACADPADPHVVVAMSGGVDSSVAALLAQRGGYRTTGIFMKNWNEPASRESGECQWENDVEDVMAVCDRLGISVNTVDLSAAYWHSVFAEFLDEYKRGRTPNPDILCNREVKFKAFLEHARELGADLIATGHYVRSTEHQKRIALRKGLDGSKDQSYFLYAIGQSALGRSIFPVGDMEKSVVRAIAADAGLPVHDKKDSTGICFIGERHFREFMSNYLPAQPGDIVTVDGQRLGQHQGAMYYTLGQREGLGIGGVHGAPEGPWFVVSKDVVRNELTVAQGHENPMLMSRTLWADTLSWVDEPPRQFPLQCAAKTRYRQNDQDCEIISIDDGVAEVVFAAPQRAVTPGQSVVFYQGDICLGGGIIDRTA